MCIFWLDVLSPTCSMLIKISAQMQLVKKKVALKTVVLICSWAKITLTNMAAANKNAYFFEIVKVAETMSPVWAKNTYSGLTGHRQSHKYKRSKAQQCAN